MGFRTLEISHAAELHIKEGQLEITTNDGVAVVPIEDLNQIMVHGRNQNEENWHMYYIMLVSSMELR